jgi:hypothetical protein
VCSGSGAGLIEGWTQKPSLLCKEGDHAHLKKFSDLSGFLDLTQIFLTKNPEQNDGLGQSAPR